MRLIVNNTNLDTQSLMGFNEIPPILTQSTFASYNPEVSDKRLGLSKIHYKIAAPT